MVEKEPIGENPTPAPFFSRNRYWYSVPGCSPLMVREKTPNGLLPSAITFKGSFLRGGKKR